jgi:hypothetical protein
MNLPPFSWLYLLAMIEHVTSADRYLYHYTKSSTAVDNIFKTRTLLFGRYTETNDPKEAKSWEFSLGTNQERDLGRYKIAEVSSWLSAQLKQKTRLACFSMDHGPLSGDHMKDVHRRGYAKPRMWAQYGERHTGVCIVFDRQKLLHQIDTQCGSTNLVVSGPVRYQDREVVRGLDNHEYMVDIDLLETIGRDQYVREHLRTHIQTLFFEKMTDWRDEHEWRSVVFSSADTDLYLELQDAIVGVMFGEDTSEKVIQDIMDLSTSWGLRYMGLKWKNSSLWYDYGNLRYLSGIKNSPWGAFIKRV